MGWSCEMLAGKRLDLIMDLCHKNSGMTNVWTENNNKYMFETGREQADGSITGTISKYIDDSKVKKSGSFKIEAGGIVSRGPKFFKKKAYLLFVFQQNCNWHETIKDYIPSDEELGIMRKEINDQYLPGGLNHHITVSRGYIPYVNKIVIVDLDINDNSVNSHHGKRIVKTH